MKNRTDKMWRDLLGTGIILAILVCIAAGFFSCNTQVDKAIKDVTIQPAKAYNVSSEQLRADMKDLVSDETYDELCDTIIDQRVVTYLRNGDLHVVFITNTPAGAYPEYPTMVYKYSSSGYTFSKMIVTYLSEGPAFSE